MSKRVSRQSAPRHQEVSPDTQGTLGTGETKRPATYADYKATPEDERWELLRGTLVREPSPGYHHQTVIRRLFRQLMDWAPETGPVEVLCAPFDVVLTALTVVQPDMLVFRTDKRVTERGLEEPPDLAVEILSPHSGHKDLETKRSIYAQAGVREYWVIDPEARRIHQLISGGSGGRMERDVTVAMPSEHGPASPSTLQSRIFPSLLIRLDRLFYPYRKLDE